jgi:uroporphyrinogen-III synthase
MKSQKILYLGIDPSRFPHEGELIHFPVIETHSKPFVGEVKQAFEQLSVYTHIILTSRTAATLFVDYARKTRETYKEKIYLSVGTATTAYLKEQEIGHVLTADEQTGEGVVALLQELDLNGAHLFFPHSALARTLIPDYCNTHHIPLTAIALYDTKPTNIPLPNLDDFDQIVFTSPSTVHAFFAQIKKIPIHIQCLSIGPVTEASLKKYVY